MMTTTPEPAERAVGHHAAGPKPDFRVARAFAGTDNEQDDAGEASVVSREQDTTNTN